MGGGGGVEVILFFLLWNIICEYLAFHEGDKKDKINKIRRRITFTDNRGIGMYYWSHIGKYALCPPLVRTRSADAIKKI
jgi:hypothetical protein